MARSTPAAYLAYLRGLGIPYMVAGAERVDLVEAAAALADRLGVQCIASESGGGLNGVWKKMPNN